MFLMKLVRNLSEEAKENIEDLSEYSW